MVDEAFGASEHRLGGVVAVMEVMPDRKGSLGIGDVGGGNSRGGRIPILTPVRIPTIGTASLGRCCELAPFHLPGVFVSPSVIRWCGCSLQDLPSGSSSES